MKRDTLRIGCASGFWGDTEFAAAQLVERGDIDVLVFDYLAEITMSLLIRAKAKDPTQGYAPDFVATMKPLMKQIKARGIQVVANAGGVNPSACRDALVAAAQAEGVELKIAAVLGDDLMPQVEAMRAAGVKEMFSGAAFPAKVMSANAYLGAFPDRCGAGRRRRHRRHRPLRRQRGDAGAADRPLRLEGRRAGPAGAGQPGRPPDRVRHADHRRQLHRLGQRAGLGRHGLPHRRVPRRRQLRRHQAGRHRRTGLPVDGGRADALRDRRPAGLHPARRGVRLHRRDADAGRPRPGRGQGRARPPAHRPGQGQPDLRRRLPGDEPVHDRRHRRRRQGAPHRRGDAGAHAPPLRRARLARLHRGQRRGDRRRGHLRRAGARPRRAR